MQRCAGRTPHERMRCGVSVHVISATAAVALEAPLNVFLAFAGSRDRLSRVSIPNTNIARAVRQSSKMPKQKQLWAKRGKIFRSDSLTMWQHDRALFQPALSTKSFTRQSAEPAISVTAADRRSASQWHHAHFFRFRCIRRHSWRSGAGNAIRDVPPRGFPAPHLPLLTTSRSSAGLPERISAH